MNIGKAYQYFFYQLYKFIKVTPRGESYAEWLTFFYLCLLECFLMFSVTNYCVVLPGNSLNIYENDFFIYFFLLFLFAFNYRCFLYKNRWEYIIAQFNKLPVNKRKRNYWIATALLILIYANLIFSFFLLSQNSR